MGTPEETTRVKGHIRRHDGNATYVKSYERRTAKGIPDRDMIKRIPSSTGTWDMSIQEHNADRAGKHYDLRLGVGKDAHSWALRYLPGPGEARLAVQQPTHTREYMKWEGVIPKGYGKGTVKMHDKGSVEVVESSDNKIVFNRFRGKQTDEFVLIRTKDKNWILLNRSTTIGKYNLPRKKPKYEEIEYSEDLAKMDGVMQPKIDGGHCLVLLRPGMRPRVFSYRESKLGIPLEYTHKIEGLFKHRSPKNQKKMILRAEIYLQNKDGSAAPVERTAGVLNSTVENARYLQSGTNGMKIVPFDIHGDDSSYEKKLKLLDKVIKKNPFLDRMPTATSREEKTDMIRRVRKGKYRLTAEGLVLRTKSGRLYKSKIVDDKDVYVIGVFAGKGKYKGMAAGGFVYSLTPDGPPAGKVGTGLTDSQRIDLWKNRNKVIGSVATVGYNRQTKSGALFAPRFIRWHPEKNQ